MSVAPAGGTSGEPAPGVECEHPAVASDHDRDSVHHGRAAHAVGCNCVTPTHLAGGRVHRDDARAEAVVPGCDRDARSRRRLSEHVTGKGDGRAHDTRGGIEQQQASVPRGDHQRGRTCGDRRVGPIAEVDIPDARTVATRECRRAVVGRRDHAITEEQRRHVA
jgi:hypothetical protein